LEKVTFFRILNNIAEAMQYIHLAFLVLTRNNQRNSACEIL